MLFISYCLFLRHLKVIKHIKNPCIGKGTFWDPGNGTNGYQSVYMCESPAHVEICAFGSMYTVPHSKETISHDFIRH